jgi:hypothetical protein
MATPSFSKQLNIVDPQFTPPVSKAGLIEGERYSNLANTLKMGVEFATDYSKKSTLKELESDLSTESEKYIAQSPSYQGLLKKNIESLEAEINQTKGNPNLAPDAIDVKVKEIQSQLNTETQRLTNARDQGTITPLELETRLDRITRDKVAQNPMFRKEIIAHGAQTKDLLGISGIVKQDIDYYNKLDQARKENETRIYKMADDYKLDLNEDKFKNLDGTRNLQAIEIEANKKRGYIGVKQMGDTLAGMKDIETKLKKEDILNNDLPNKFLQGNMVILQNEVSSLFNMPITEANYTDRLRSLEAAIQKGKMSINGMTGRYRNDKDIAWIRDDYDNMSQRLLDNFKNIKNGKELNDFFTNHYNAIDSKQKLGLASRFNLPEQRFILDVVDKAGPMLSSTQKTQLTTTAFILANQFSLSQSSKNIQLSNDVLIDTFGKKLQSGQTQGDMLIKQTSEEILKTDVNNPMFEYSSTTFGNLLKSQHMYINSGTISSNEKLKESDKVMLTLGNSKLRAKNIQFSEDVKGDITELIQNYAKDVDTEITKLKGRPDGITINTSPDGTLVAVKDPSVKVASEMDQRNYINKFNGVIINRINNSLKAYATLYNMDTKTAAPEFLSKFYGSTFSNLQSVKDQVDTTPGLTDKQKEANKILGM